VTKEIKNILTQLKKRLKVKARSSCSSFSCDFVYIFQVQPNCAPKFFCS